MRIVELRSENFRRFAAVRLHFDHRLSVLIGDNGAGKTSLLEMLFVLGRGRSFRAPAAAEIAGPAARSWSVYGQARVRDVDHHIGVGWQGESTEQRIDGEPCQVLDLAKLWPMQVLEPEMHRIVQDGPTYRRSFVDWGVFHVEPSFMTIWRRYRRALRQRNQVLRQSGADRELSPWEQELADTGAQLNEVRQRHVSGLQPLFGELLAEWLPGRAVSIELAPGWASETDLLAALKGSRERDRKLGATSLGPHRAELKIRFDAHRARGRVSRGQQKLLIASLLLAQCQTIESILGRAPTLLVDDFSAELAAGFQTWLLHRLNAYSGHVVLTSFEASPLLRSAEPQMFHVEHGQVRAA